MFGERTDIRLSGIWQLGEAIGIAHSIIWNSRFINDRMSASSSRFERRSRRCGRAAGHSEKSASGSGRIGNSTSAERLSASFVSSGKLKRSATIVTVILAQRFLAPHRKGQRRRSFTSMIPPPSPPAGIFRRARNDSQSFMGIKGVLTPFQREGATSPIFS